MDIVCHIITKLELGGAQEVALYAVSHLDKSRFRPVLITGPGGLLTEEAQRIAGIEVIVLPSLIRDIRLSTDLLTWIRLLALFRRLRPTIVHTHSSKAGLLGRWAAWWARVPIIVHTIHGYGITPAQPAWLRRILIALERLTGWITTHWIAVAHSDVTKGRVWHLFRDNVTVIRAGIDPKPFEGSIDAAERDRLREEFGAGRHDVLVGTVACLKPQKAPEDFIAVAKQVCAETPRARFVLIGDGELRPHIEALIEASGLRDHVRLMGWRRDIPRAMKALDAFLLTSHWEGLPRVLLEARAAGIPVVATRVGGADEAIDHRQGCLSAPGDIAGLVEQLSRVIRARPAVSQKKRMEEMLPKEFHIEEMAKEYQSLYDRLMRARMRDEQDAWSTP